jgi:DNA segregation ATPase FtsK/SpoIIIE, S-DNA-T family
MGNNEETKKSQKKTKPKNKSSFLKFLTDDRTKLLLSFLLLGFSFLLLVSQISFLFTWKTDQSFEWSKAWTDTDYSVENWAGKIGAFLSNLTINKWFGIAAFTLPFLISLLSLKLIDIKIIPFGKTLIKTLIATIIISIWCSFIAKKSELFGAGPGGRHGHYMSMLLVNLLGNIGTFILLLIATLGISMFISRKSILVLKRILRRLAMIVFPFLRKKDETSDVSEEDDDETYIIPENKKKGLFEDDKDLVFETEFPQREHNSDQDNLKLKVNNIIPSEQSLAADVDEMTIIEDEGQEDGEYLKNLPLEDYDPTLELSSFKLPPFDLL